MNIIKPQKMNLEKFQEIFNTKSKADIFEIIISSVQNEKLA